MTLDSVSQAKSRVISDRSQYLTSFVILSFFYIPKSFQNLFVQPIISSLVTAFMFSILRKFLRKLPYAAVSFSWQTNRGYLRYRSIEAKILTNTHNSQIYMKRNTAVFISYTYLRLTHVSNGSVASFESTQGLSAHWMILLIQFCSGAEFQRPIGLSS